jgi:hypothetical protein
VQVQIVSDTKRRSALSLGERTQPAEHACQGTARRARDRKVMWANYTIASFGAEEELEETAEA